MVAHIAERLNDQPRDLNLRLTPRSKHAVVACTGPFLKCAIIDAVFVSHHQLRCATLRARLRRDRALLLLRGVLNSAIVVLRPHDAALRCTATSVVALFLER